MNETLKIGDGVKFLGWANHLVIPEGVEDLEIGKIGLVFATDNAVAQDGSKGIGVIFIRDGVELFSLHPDEFEKV